MKKIYYSLILLTTVFTCKAQYVPTNSQAFQFIYLYNPAFAGVENFDDVKFGYRYQWAGFGKYSPRFLNLSYQKRIKQPLDMSYNSQRLSNSSRTGQKQLPRGKRIIHALGGNIFQSNVGVIRSIGGSFNYALNYPLTEMTRFAFGASGVLENRKMDLSEVTLRDPDEYYNYLLRSSSSQTDFSVRVGALLYGEKFYVGVSYLPVLNIPLQASDLALEQPFYRASIQGGVSFSPTDDVKIKPSILALLQMNNKVVIDYNVKAYLQNKVWLGLTYRDVKSGVAILGFNINEKFTASYSYELSLGEFKRFDDGSHELVLAARLKNLKRYSQYIW
jgi:type IX secretion system PorP/SprF family membrane protein